MLTHKIIRDDVKKIIADLTSSERTVVDFFTCLKPIGSIIACAFIFDAVGVVVDLLFHMQDIPIGGMLLFQFLTVIVGLIIVGVSIKPVSIYYSISSELRNELPSLRFFVQKIKKYLKINLVLWLLVTFICCITGGGSALIPIFMAFSIVISFAFFAIDTSRYELSGIIGTIKGAETLFVKSDNR